MATTVEHPSNKLYSGDVTDFHEAMRLVIRQCEFEKRHTLVAEFDGHPEKYEPLTPEEREFYRRDDEKQAASLNAYIAAANQAIGIYREHVDAAVKAAIEAMRATGSNDLAMIADALEASDYSSLAI